jgi:hypothetical protein
MLSKRKTEDLLQTLHRLHLCQPIVTLARLQKLVFLDLAMRTFRQSQSQQHNLDKHGSILKQTPATSSNPKFLAN